MFKLSRLFFILFTVKICGAFSATFRIFISLLVCCCFLFDTHSFASHVKMVVCCFVYCLFNVDVLKIGQMTDVSRWWCPIDGTNPYASWNYRCHLDPQLQWLESFFHRRSCHCCPMRPIALTLPPPKNSKEKTKRKQFDIAMRLLVTFIKKNVLRL